MACKQAFAVWITGLPASGKSTIARSLKRALEERGIDAAVLESDELRRVLMPDAQYDAAGRERFYGALIHIGVLLADHGVPVIFDATAHRRGWRETARERIAQFFEVYAECPLEICMRRDPKGIYRRGRETGSEVPGLHETYEAPEHPDLVIYCDREEAAGGAARIVEKLIAAGFIS